MTVVTPSQPSRRERKKAGVRARIIDEAIRLFSRNGIANVTVDQIAEAADIGKGTIYNYFQTKEDIVVAFMVDVERRVQERLARSTQIELPLETLLTDLLLFQFRLKAKYLEFVRILLGHMFARTEQFIPWMQEIQNVMDPPLRKLFGELQLRGAIRPDVDLGELILTFKTIHLGLTALWAIEGRPFQATGRVLPLEMKLLCEGLMPRK